MKIHALQTGTVRVKHSCVAVIGSNRGGGLEREPRLSGPAGAGQRQLTVEVQGLTGSRPRARTSAPSVAFRKAFANVQVPVVRGLSGSRGLFDRVGGGVAFAHRFALGESRGDRGFVGPLDHRCE